MGTPRWNILKLACATAWIAASAVATAQTPAQLKVLSGTGVSLSAPQVALVNGQQAVTVPLNAPAQLCYDAAGNFYIADQNNNIIRKVDTAGIITTIAGTGEQGFDGDGGAATSATLDSPQGIAIDTSGNLYIADTRNHRIRKVSTSGIITTIAGTGVAGFSGDGGAATSATINLPTAIAADSNGNVFFADSNNNRVREIVASSSVIQTVAGNGEQGYTGDGGSATSATLDTPQGIAIDSAGNLYLSDTHNNRVRKVSGGIITTIVGDGTFSFAGDGSAATSGSLASPHGIAVNAAGTTLYVADSNNNRIRQVNSSNVISTVAGSGEQGHDQLNGSATAASLDTPRGVTTGPFVSFAFADTGNDIVRAVSNSNIVTTAGLGNQSTSLLALTASAQTTTYGQGTLTATLSSSTQATGSIIFYDYGSQVATVALASNTAILNLGSLNAGTHSLSASFAGDGSNPSAVSGVMVVTVNPLAITATITPLVLQYGQTIPAVTGSLSGVLAQDNGNVQVAFSTSATATSVPGAYAVTGTLSGSAAPNYTLSSITGNVLITRAVSLAALTSSVSNSLLGSPVTLQAAVATSTTGQPTGTVTFMDGSNILGSAQALTAGRASVAVSSLTAGAHNLTVVYSGDTNFNASTSSAAVVQISDFNFSLSSTTGSTQTVIPGRSATYNLVAAPVSGTFSFPITLSAAGLPPGATATFSPSTITLGSSNASFTLTVQTVAATAMAHPVKGMGGSAAVLALLFLPFSSCLRRGARKWKPGLLMLVLALSLAAVGGLTGCGSGTGYFGQQQQSYTVTINGTASGPNGTTLQHSSTVVLVVQ